VGKTVHNVFGAGMHPRAKSRSNVNPPNYQESLYRSLSDAPPLGWEANLQSAGSREGNQERAQAQSSERLTCQQCVPIEMVTGMPITTD